MVNQEDPLVTVYMPTHNRGDLIRKAIDSVLNQTYKNIELIICNDGSSDHTSSILEEYSSKDNRVRYLTNETSKGACFSRNRCIEIARGDFITGIDDDDEFTDKRIEIFLNAFRVMGHSILSASRIYKDQSNEKLGDLFEGKIDIKMLGDANMIGNQLFTKTSYIRSLHGFDANFPAWQDYDMWYRLVKKYGYCFKLSEPTYIFYVDEDRPRITTGSRAHAGYLMFIDKHKASLSKSNFKSLYVQDLINRGQPITFNDLSKHLTYLNLKIFIKYKLKSYYFITRLYTLFFKKNRRMERMNDGNN